MAEALLDTLPSGVRYRRWQPDGEPVAAVLMVHGLGEHSGRYQHVADALVQKRFFVIAPDHIGHGESPGDRVFVSKFEDYLDGVRGCRRVIDSSCPGLPCFILGHSMGGLITARLCWRIRPTTGALCSVALPLPLVSRPRPRSSGLAVCWQNWCRVWA